MNLIKVQSHFIAVKFYWEKYYFMRWNRNNDEYIVLFFL